MTVCLMKMLTYMASFLLAASLSPLPIDFQPYIQSDIGMYECRSPDGSGSFVECQNIYSLWLWPINPLSRFPAGAAFDLGVKKMAELINREQKLLPGYRLVAVSMDDTNTQLVAYERTMADLLAGGHKKWVALGSTLKTAGMAHHQLSWPFKVPMITAADDMTISPAAYPNQINHWWNYQSGALAVMLALKALKLDTIAVATETFKDPRHEVLDLISKQAADIGMIVSVKVSVNTGLDVLGAKLDMDVHRSLEYFWEQFLRSNCRIAYMLFTRKEFLQNFLCRAFKAGRSGLILVVPHDMNSEFYKGDATEPHRRNCTDENLLNVGDFIQTGNPPGFFSEIDPNDNITLGCFPPDTSLDYARSKNATAKRFLEQMQYIQVKQPAVYPFINTRVPGYTSAMMCHLALMIRDMFDEGVSLEQMLQHDSAELYERQLNSLRNKRFNGAWGIVSFENSSFRSWPLAVSIEQGGKWLTFSDYDVDGHAVIFRDGITPVWRDGSMGWNNRPNASYPDCLPGYVISGSTCQKCEQGKFFRSLDGMPACIKCPRGKHQMFQGQLKCTQCAEGRFTPTSGAVDCVSCGVGRFAESDGSHCVDCLKGTYKDSNDEQACKYCPKGRYADETRSAACKECGVLLTTVSIASRARDDCVCVTGYVRNNGICTWTTKNLYISAIQPNTGSWSAGESMSYGAHKMADWINENPNLLPGYELHVIWQDGACDRKTGQFLLLGNMMNYSFFPVEGPVMTDIRPVGLLGPGCSGAATTTTAIAYYGRLPMISNSATKPGLSERSKHPGFFRTISPDTAFNEAWLAVVRGLGFDEVAVMMGSQGDNWDEMAKPLLLAAKKLHVRLVGPSMPHMDAKMQLGADYKMRGWELAESWSPGGIDEARGLLDQFQALSPRPPRFIVLLMYSAQARTVLCATHKKISAAPGFMYMSFGWFSSFWWRSDLDDDLCTWQDMETAVNLTFTANCDQRRPDLTTVLTCTDGITAGDFFTYYENITSNLPGGTRTEGAATADAVCTFALMLHELLIVRNHGLSEIQPYSEEIFTDAFNILTATDFEGTQGRMKFIPGFPDPARSMIIEQLQNVDINRVQEKIVLARYFENELAWTGMPILLPESKIAIAQGSSPVNDVSFRYGESGELGMFESCSDGMVLNLGLNVCEGCPPSKTYLKLTRSCVCNPGYASNESNCVACGIGYFADALGSTSCTVCEAGTYNRRVGSTHCDRCGDGVKCRSGLEPISTEGFFMVSYARAEKCFLETETNTGRKSVCLGNQPFKSQELSCAVGHVGPLCGACAHQYSRSDFMLECRACSLNSAAGVVQGVVVLTANLIWTAALSFLSGYFVMNSLEDKCDLDPVLLRILVNWMNVCSVLQDIDWNSLRIEDSFGKDGSDISTSSSSQTSTLFPSWTHEVVSRIFWAGGNLLEISKPEPHLECIANFFGITTHNRILLVLTWWFVYPLMVGMWLLVLMFFQQTIVRFKSGTVSNSSPFHKFKLPLFFISVYLSWDLVTAKALSALSCVNFETGEEGSRTTQRFWKGDSREACADFERTAFAISTLLVWSFGFPFALFILRSRFSHNLDDQRKIYLFGFFERGFDPEYWWWELLVKRFDLLFVLVITHTSFYHDEASKLVTFTIIAGSAWGLNASCVPFMDINSNLLDDTEKFSLASRFFLMASVVSAVLFEIRFFRYLALVICGFACVICIFFFFNVVFYIFMTKSAKIAFILEGLNLEFQSKFGDSPQGARKFILRLVVRAISILSHADVTRHRLTESALRFQFTEVPQPLKIVLGERPAASGNYIRQLWDRVIWTTYGLESKEQLDFCFSSMATIQRLVVESGGDFPSQRAVALLTMSLQQAKSSAGLYGHALLRARTVHGFGHAAPTVQHDSADNLIAIAKQIVEEQRQIKLDSQPRHFSGDDLFSLILSMESHSNQELVRMFSTVAKILEEPHTQSQASLKMQQHHYSPSVPNGNDDKQAIALDSSAERPVFIEARERSQTTSNRIEGVAAPESTENVELKKKLGIASSESERLYKENALLVKMNSEQNRTMMVMKRRFDALSAEAVERRDLDELHGSITRLSGQRGDGAVAQAQPAEFATEGETEDLQARLNWFTSHWYGMYTDQGGLREATFEP